MRKLLPVLAILSGLLFSLHVLASDNDPGYIELLSNDWYASHGETQSANFSDGILTITTSASSGPTARARRDNMIIDFEKYQWGVVILDDNELPKWTGNAEFFIGLWFSGSVVTEYPTNNDYNYYYVNQTRAGTLEGDLCMYDLEPWDWALQDEPDAGLAFYFRFDDTPNRAGRNDEQFLDFVVPPIEIEGVRLTFNFTGLEPNLSQQVRVRAIRAYSVDPVWGPDDDTSVPQRLSENVVWRSVNGKILLNGLQEGMEINVYDMLGKAVYQGFSRGDRTEMDLNQGIYVVRLRSGSDVHAFRVLNTKAF